MSITIGQWCVSYIMVSTSDSSHTCVHFADMSVPENIPGLVLFNIFNLTCASNHTSAQLCISHLAMWFCTHHLSESTFRPPRTTYHSGFPTFSRACIFLFLIFLFDCFFSPLLLFDSSRLCFSCVRIVGSLTSKFNLCHFLLCFFT